MSIRTLAVVPAVVFLLSGCVFFKEPYAVPEIYDTPVPVRKCQVPAGRVKVRNISGADRRFFYKLKDSRVVHDANCLWISGPDALLKRSIHETFVCGTPEGIDINCTVSRFEFNVSGKTAVLVLQVTLESGERKKIFTLNESAAYISGSRASAAGAMNSCIGNAVEKICLECRKFSEEKGNKK